MRSLKKKNQGDYKTFIQYKYQSDYCMYVNIWQGLVNIHTWTNQNINHAVCVLGCRRGGLWGRGLSLDWEGWRGSSNSSKALALEEVGIGLGLVGHLGLHRVRLGRVRVWGLLLWHHRVIPWRPLGLGSWSPTIRWWGHMGPALFFLQTNEYTI